MGQSYDLGQPELAGAQCGLLDLRSYRSGRLCNRYLVSGDISSGGNQGQTLEVNTLLGAMPQGTRKTLCPVIVQDFYSGMRTHQGTSLFEPLLLSLSS